MPTGQHWHYGWDGAGQLASVTRPDGYAVTFTYDALGRRVSKRFRGRVTRWAWDGDKPLHEWHELEIGPGTGAVQELTTWLFEENSFVPAAKLTAQGAFSVVADHLGTPLELYNTQGQKTWQAHLDCYGQVREGKGKPQDCPFRYQGQYEDTETGLYYNRFRYYDPEAGYYISQDPIGLHGGWELYSYVPDPCTWVDVLGLTGCSKNAELLRTGGNNTTVNVKTKAEADALLKEAFPDYQKVKGVGPQDAVGIRKKMKMDRFKQGGAYHKDYAIDHATGRVRGHEIGNAHGEYPHINIKRTDGVKVLINITGK